MTTHLTAETSRLVTRSIHPAITSDASAFEAGVSAAERLVVILERPGPEHRGRLLEFVLSGIEAQLERAGAAPPSSLPDDSFELKLSDQLYRTRLLGAGGLALRFAPLDGLADAAGELGTEDSGALRRLLAVAEREPLQLFLPEPSGRLNVLGAARPLAEWLPAAAMAGRVASIEYELVGEPAVSLAPSDAVAAPKPTPRQPAVEPATLAPPEVDAFRAPAQAPRLEEGAEGSESNVPALARGPQELASVAPGAPAPLPAEPRSEPADSEPAGADEAQRRCSAWAAQLQSMSGPKLHASVERAFLTAYLPLAREVAAGTAPQETRAAVETWAEGFAQSYAAAFKTLSSSTKRPMMVRDVFELATRWLNQNRARQCQLLLVDAMRFDLGQRLNQQIERQLRTRAVCRDQTLLWAALPSNSESQRLGVSPGQVRSARHVRLPAAPETPLDRAAAVESVRVGVRELFRINRLPAELAHPGEPEAARLDRLAIMLADVIVPWLKTQPPDTLVLLFGDHGFYWQSSERGTTAAQRGGALPEQVFVPASAWLISSGPSKAGVAPGVH